MASQMSREILDGDEDEELLEALAHIWNHLFSFISSMTLKCSIQLGIPDIINNHSKKPITLSEIVTALGIPITKSSHIYRLMRILVHSGFFAVQEIHPIREEQEEKEGYVLTPSSKLLLRGHPMSITPFVLSMLDPVLVTPWYFLNEWFHISDELITPFEATHKASIWTCFGENKQTDGKLFDEGMAADARLMTSVVLKKFKGNLEGLRSLVDVGGGIGTLARAIAEAFPCVKCTVLDMPHVVGTLQGSKNLEFISGDMFESIPYAQAVILKWILHDWSDEECVKILKRCREAIPAKEEGGKVIIIDMVVNESRKEGDYQSTETQLYSDMVMLALTTGRERTETEWEKLFLDAGFSSYKIAPIFGLRSFIEVFPQWNSMKYWCV